MKDPGTVLQTILDQGLLPLFYWDDAEVSLEVVRTLYKAGVRAVEYTNRGNKALDNFKLLKRTLAAEAPDLHLGIGTVKSAGEALAFIHAGADLIVSPLVNPEIAALTEKADLLWIPGAMTPTEIYQAQQSGARLIKIFPANILGPEFISSVRELFPGQLFIPTGGVELDQENIRNWFKAGVSAVGMGSKLITKDVLKSRQFDVLYKNAQKAMEMVKAGR
ncbi:MAG: bifunctional 4-hydroxy-2-oxoglutarate aldolase/2-dehydro-3-deoxy-phosphogluconate aldolase [Bacteroidota bacterium]|nr:bifunctional 4-hydroxy-2-oxoglutarate aldolase/2-dehydro-3-deoxy-phosphogluconate aldolase [Bacteroidota bacterium]MDP4214999.1 bifunctional 4-hydroxy-2-oxoglutarate aldolase/2-dehydro-3-deoxy-phosphogluconate aldolase [Bacteroidota bacterium]MDP4244254.1 bifunctional 4-hydroxy-2-oxoglutarate aldolase/2-dehydro-3-deoxy-phosphogluconate aldolase [Bacteroidota bacterium]MDP4254081.1 bifunctional 4-hydroxy-2-oxoglutarate aldolase/2-dehydro-3-deoxy-phosphogluconate aldolase [Bacteroidota bacteriu